MRQSTDSYILCNIIISSKTHHKRREHQTGAVTKHYRVGQNKGL